MKTKYAFNALSGEFDIISEVPQLDGDPAIPIAGDLWVKKSGGTTGGTIKAFIGMSAPFPTASGGGSATYQLSYRTNEGTIVRTTLT